MGHLLPTLPWRNSMELRAAFHVLQVHLLSPLPACLACLSRDGLRKLYQCSGHIGSPGWALSDCEGWEPCSASVVPFAMKEVKEAKDEDLRSFKVDRQLYFIIYMTETEDLQILVYKGDITHPLSVFQIVQIASDLTHDSFIFHFRSQMRQPADSVPILLVCVSRRECHHHWQGLKD